MASLATGSSMRCAFTAHDQKGVRAAAETFRANPDLDIAAAIMQLKVGEALVSFLDDKGAPAMAQRAHVVPPGSQIGPITAAQRAEILKASVLAGHYEKAIDRESAYEILKKKEPGAVAERPAPHQGAPANHAPAEMDTEAAEQGRIRTAALRGASAAARKEGPGRTTDRQCSPLLCQKPYPFARFRHWPRPDQAAEQYSQEQIAHPGPESLFQRAGRHVFRGRGPFCILAAVFARDGRTPFFEGTKPWPLASFCWDSLWD